MGKSVAVLALAIAVAIVAIGSMREDSATADEAAHIAAGLLKLREAHIDFYATQTPLIEVLIAAPLAMAGYRVPEEWRQYGNRPWVAGHLLLYRSGYDSQRILRIARLPVIALLLALCFAVWSFVREVTGDDVAALAAFALTGFCPTLLAHGRLATVDVGVTLFFFLATMLLLRLLRAPSFSLGVATGVAVACTLASKVSGALIIPFFAIVIALWFVERRRPAPADARASRALAGVVEWQRGTLPHQPAR
ncbi:MAG: ArnT family glycosyltransferase, partial [Thermoanaerobaculia bacterium]